ncbi:SDR family oxidoreductase [Telluribacter sp.]|jgi:NAD(P)-dependent dehydrogenase (short-subunit alcohol dehydrogenase family)|uniref:SDR family oxidoreductase n=1 Tax=Telluribacter sp. TaxID=1978767 RepID=UPI002E163EE1|nr:SDR family oxidoreductase [Telluribacter sp.]
MTTQRTALITGPTSGIGRITALKLANKQFDLILVARNADKTAELQREIGSRVSTWFIECDLSSLASVREAVKTIREKFQKIDVHINNAGLILDHEEFSPDGLEKTFAVNHVAHFLLTTELLDLIKAGTRPRIIHLSSEAHRAARFQIDQLVKPDKYSGFRTYANSKLANILFSNELAERLLPTGISSNALHPGGVATNFAGEVSGLYKLAMWLARPFFISPEEGARTTLFLASSPKVEGITGKYFSDLKIKKPNTEAQSSFLAKKLWALSEELVRDFRVKT